MVQIRGRKLQQINNLNRDGSYDGVDTGDVDGSSAMTMEIFMNILKNTGIRFNGNKRVTDFVLSQIC